MRFSYEFSNILGAVFHRGTLQFGHDNASVFSPVGNKIVVYDLKSGRSNALPVQVNYNINIIAIHPKSTILLAATERNHLFIISLVSGRQLHMKEYPNLGGKITHVSFSPCGNYYCVCGHNIGLVYLTPGALVAGKGRDMTPFRIFRKFTVHHDTISSISWSQDSRYIAFASRDMSLTVFDMIQTVNGFVHLKGHSDTLEACYFANTHPCDRTLYAIARNSQLSVWSEKEQENGSDNDEARDEMQVDGDPYSQKETDSGETKQRPLKKRRAIMQYYRKLKLYLKPEGDENETKVDKKRRFEAYVTATAFNNKAKLLVLGYSHGQYALYEMPDGTLVHKLSIEVGGVVDSLAINGIGDWIAVGSSVTPSVDADGTTNNSQSRLIVWEWQSKSNVLDLVGSGSSMSCVHECLSYSLDGAYIVTGRSDGKIRVWNALTGDIVATFGNEHKGPVRAIKFAPNKSGKVIVSASMDGTVRAYDMVKFHNFRTLTHTHDDRKPEFICMDIDSTGEFIAAGTYNYFEIYLWSLQTGRFMEFLTGHEGPVSGVAFSPRTNLLVSCSWDHTIRVWSLFEAKCSKEIITLPCEAITVVFRADGLQIAVALANGHIVFYDPLNVEQFGTSIEGSADLGVSQTIDDVSRDTRKYFTTVNYTADGTHIIAAGRSNMVCLYNVREKILIKKFAMTCNMSMDGLFDYISYRKRAEFGFNLELIASRQENQYEKPIKLPGVKKGELSERSAQPIIGVSQVQFSPTMRAFVCATTEGVLVYSLDVHQHFDPYKLAINTTPETARSALKLGNFGEATMHAIQLDNKHLLTEIIENTPLDLIESVVANMALDYVQKLLAFLGRSLVHTKHYEFYLLWIKHTLYRHGFKLKSLTSLEVTPIIRDLHQNLYRIHENIRHNCDHTKYTLSYITKLAEIPKDDDTI